MKKTLKKTRIRTAPIKASFTKLYVSALAVLVIVICVLSLPFSVTYKQAHSKAQTAVPIKGSSLQLEKLTWHIEDSKKAMVPSDEKHHYITTSLELKNITDHDVWLSPVLQMYIVDTARTKHPIDIVMVDNPLEGGPIHAGQGTHGDVAFYVPNDDKNLVWCMSDTDGVDICMPLNEFNKGAL